QPSQGYLNAATAGIDANCMWQLPGGTGANSAIADLEYSWNLAHQDLGTVTLLGAAPNDPFADDNHGTAVLGEMVSLNNGWGVTGATYNSTMYVVAVNTGPGAGTYNVGAAITTALGTLTAGDVILIEQQFAGPNYTGIPAGTQFGLVAVEWYQPYYNAIVTAVGNGVVVVEAAGNGWQNLDAPEYGTGNGGHWPFMFGNDSGAIIVGAGASPGGSDTDRSRLNFSNYGATVDLQGWGENVYTTGYGTVYFAEGKNLWYDSAFGGTSSASPIVASACSLLQSTHQSAAGAFLTPAQVRSNLITTGSAQLAGTFPTSQNIGPRPDASAALCNALPAIDANANLVPDLCEQLAGIVACCFTGGGCTDTTQTNCANNGGTSQGLGTACATTQCPVGPANEACCLPGGACADMPPANCTASAGTPQGAGTLCLTTVCQVTEACCFPGPVSTCADMLPAACQAGGGLPQGPGTNCATTFCRPMLPKFVQPPTQDREDIPSNIDLLNMVPNVVVADDFQSDGRPITVVRWWGSYIDPQYMPVAHGGMPSPFEIDGWLISFHEPLTSGPGLPPQPALGLYFAEAADVTILLTGIPSCDGHPVFEYTVEIIRCCLLWAQPDSRSGWIPAQFEAFEEQHCFVYDIDIQAVVGASYERDPGSGMCIQVGSNNIGQGADFWGWHATDIENGFRQALQSVTQPAPIGAPWMYGPWGDVQPICGPAPVNMAFELWTDDPVDPPPCMVACCYFDGSCADMLEQDCIMSGGESQGPGTNCGTTVCEINVPKFEQPVAPEHEDIPSCIDLQAMVPNIAIADDFQSDGRPITWVQWWGSYLDPRFQPIEFGGEPTPFEIDGWLISFHEPLDDNSTIPPQQPLALYFIPAADISLMMIGLPACDGHPVYEYQARLRDGCLLYAQPDSRSGSIPGQPDAFFEEHCFWYDIDIEAVVGKTYVRDTQTGACIEMPTQNFAEGMDFWGWHTTDLENGRRSALTTIVTPGPAGTLLFGPWNYVQPFCSPPPVNMAFVLWTNEPIVPDPCPCP
ncbi:MAG: S8 family serine peptidase, partial [bacterium]|nr:S8 family serine peptidase [bacterium]